jgi:hypothetical protein
MATGRVATTVVTSGSTLQSVYQVPAGYYGVYNVSFCNYGGTSSTIRMAISTSNSAPGAGEYYEYGTVIAAGGVFERTGLVAQAGLYIVIWSTSTSVAVNVYGIETSTS